MTDRYEIAIIGSGPGGYVAGIRAGQLGMKAVVVEREPALGGVCLNWGCIPTKALLRNAEMVRFVAGRADEFGISVGEPQFAWDKAVARSRRVVARMNKGVASLLKKNGTAIVRGSAIFADAHSLAISGGDVDRIEAEHIIVATGSRSRLLSGMTADGRRVLTSRHAVQMETLPARLLVMGAGAVGMEFADVYQAYGTEVTVIEMLDRVLPLEDAEAGALVARHFEKRGIDVRVGTRVDAVDVGDDAVRLSVSKDGRSEVLAGDAVLVAIGRAPNTDGIGLESVGVETERGFVQVDADLRTSVPNIYAIGDVAGPPMLAHKASHEAVHVVEHLAGRPVSRIDLLAIPSCTYCHPQVASVGLTEDAARSAGLEVKVSKFPFVGIGKAVAIGEHDGWVKIVAGARYGEILGAVVVGPDATELIHELALARAAELTAADVAATIHAHPTLSEAVHEAALGLVDAPLHI